MKPVAAAVRAAFLLLMLLAGAAPAHANAYQALSEIDAAVTAFLAAERPDANVRPVDQRLKLAACEVPLALDWTPAGNALAVRCSGPAAWKLYVPVAGPAFDPGPSDTDAKVVRLRTSLTRGSLIAPSDVELVPADGGVSSDTVRQIEAVAGQRLRQSVSAGTTLRLSMLERAPTIRRKDRVIIIAAGKGFRISAEGEAEQDGRVGQRILVRNLSTGERLRGVVGEGATVLIGL